ncbi:MAG: SAM-dependent methyltransferase, partial [Candidatus Omnitrophica bacterium]|nr:SAM-dependent methyltransferase [Candidatus Omnitrophota bacterium]
MNHTINPIPSSFRDPSGFLFVQNQTLYRAITNFYKEDYDFLMESGLYQDLIEEELLISHREVENVSQENSFYKIIQPEKIPFISYSYEWTFSQLKDAALLTLAIQKKALAYGMTLKDCSAYNIQFRNGKCIFIDTLSFERYQPGTPWVAYLQFCQHFLAPLALMAYTDIRLNQLIKIYTNGIPLDLARCLLPVYTYVISSLLMHIHMHARFQEKYSTKRINRHKFFMGLNSFRGLIDSLEGGIKRLRVGKRSSPWTRYYETNHYSPIALQHKSQIVAD